MTRVSRLARWSAACLALAPALAAAHPGHYHPGEEDEFDSLTAGLVHPLTGIDHLLLAVAAGWLIAALATGRRGAGGGFLGALLGGALIGRFVGAFPGMELAIALSVAVAGVLALVLRAASAPGPATIVGVLCAGAFVHGMAHGAEAGGHFGVFAIGFLLGNGLLLGIGALLKRPLDQPWRSKMAGAALMAAGAVFAVQAL